MEIIVIGITCETELNIVSEWTMLFWPLSWRNHTVVFCKKIQKLIYLVSLDDLLHLPYSSWGRHCTTYFSDSFEQEIFKCFIGTYMIRRERVRPFANLQLNTNEFCAISVCLCCFDESKCYKTSQNTFFSYFWIENFIKSATIFGRNIYLFIMYKNKPRIKLIVLLLCNYQR